MMRAKHPVILHALTAVAVTFMFGSPARAADLYNTLAQSSAGVDSISSTFRVGLSFKTTATDYIIDSVSLPLLKDVGTGNGTVDISIYDANGTNSRPGGIIGTAIGQVDTSALTNSFQTFTFSSLNRTLSPSTNYYIVMSSTNITSGAARAGITSDNTGAITTGSLGYSFYNSGWNGPYTGFWVRGFVSTVAAPEPSTWALAAIATGVTAAVARRRKT